MKLEGKRHLDAKQLKNSAPKLFVSPDVDTVHVLENRILITNIGKVM